MDEDDMEEDYLPDIDHEEQSEEGEEEEEDNNEEDEDQGSLMDNDPLDDVDLGVSVYPNMRVKILCRRLEELDRVRNGELPYVSNVLNLANPRDAHRYANVVMLENFLDELLEQGGIITVRSLFYLFRTEFNNSTHACRRAIQDTMRVHECSRWSLRIKATAKGLVRGKLKLASERETILCYERDTPISEDMCQGEFIAHVEHDDLPDDVPNPLCILVIEKDSIFQHLAYIRFYEEYPCIMVTGKGIPDVATRMFVHKLKQELNLPVFGLCDCNPGGLVVLHSYRLAGRMEEAETSLDMRWVALFPSDLDRLNIAVTKRLPMTRKGPVICGNMIANDGSFAREGEPERRTAEIQRFLDNQQGCPCAELEVLYTVPGGLRGLLMARLPPRQQDGTLVNVVGQSI